MVVHNKEKCLTDPNAEIRDGYASWDEGMRKHISIKYAWFDKRGHACRGGEIPVEALPQMVAVAIKRGYLSRSEIFASK